MMRSLAIFLSALVLWVSSPAFAQPTNEQLQQYKKTGSDLLAASKYAEALQSFEAAYKIAKDPVVIYNMGLCYWGMEKDTEALKKYQEAVQLLQSNEAQLPAYIETLQKLKGKIPGLVLEGALIVEAKELSQNVDSLLIKTEKVKLSQEGDKQYKLQEYEAAITKYKAAYAVSPDPALLFSIGQCHQKLGRKQEAKDSYETSLRDLPAGSAVRNQAEEALKSLSVTESPATKPTDITPEMTPVKPPTALYVAGIGAGVLGVGGIAAALVLQANINDGGNAPPLAFSRVAFAGVGAGLVATSVVCFVVAKKLQQRASKNSEAQANLP